MLSGLYKTEQNSYLVAKIIVLFDSLKASPTQDVQGPMRAGGCGMWP